MRGPLGGRKVKVVAPEPKTREIESSRASGVLCVCGHRFVNHGDRAITSCDGAYDGKATTTRTGPATPLCDCRGWERDEMRRTA